MSLKHKARCKDCKAAVLRMLQGFATVTPGWRSGWTTHIDEILRDPANPGRVLSEIYNALVPYRGFDSFAVTKRLPPCDFLVSGSPPFLVEFDESQHFTVPRRLAFGADSLGLVPWLR